MRTIGYLLVLVSVFNCNSINASISCMTGIDFEDSKVIFTLDDLDWIRGQSVTPLLYGAVHKKTYGSLDKNDYIPISRSSSSDTVVSSADTISWFSQARENVQIVESRELIKKYRILHTRQMIQIDQNIPVSPITISLIVPQAEESESCIKTLSRGMACLLGLCGKK